MSAAAKAQAAQPESGTQRVGEDTLKCLALAALGGCKAVDNGDSVLSHLRAIELDLDMLQMVMTHDQCDATRLSSFVLRLIERVGVVREMYEAKGDGT